MARIKKGKLRQIISEELQRAQAKRIIKEALGGNAIDIAAACVDRLQGDPSDAAVIGQCERDLLEKYPSQGELVRQLVDQLQVISDETGTMQSDMGGLQIDRLQRAEKLVPSLAVKIITGH